MITLILIGLLASSALAEPTADTTQLSFGALSDSYSNYIVKDGEYIAMLAKRYYGDEEYWTNIWNDNPDLENASQVEAGSVLKIRNNKTILPEALGASLSARLTTSYSYSQETGIEITNQVVNTSAQIISETSDTDNAPRVLSDAQITYLGQCEAGMDPTKNTGNGYYGAFQFSIPTWNSMGTGYARADLAPLDVQIDAVQRLLSRSSIFTQFPGCARKMRSNGLI